MIDKILCEYEIFENTSFLAQISLGPIPHNEFLYAIELLGTKVAPVVRKYTRSNTSNKVQKVKEPVV